MTRDVNVVSQNKTTDKVQFLTSMFSEFADELVATIRKYFGSGPPPPEDVAQNAFTKLVEMPTHCHIDNPKAFLFKIAFNDRRRSIKQVKETQDFIDSILHRQSNAEDAHSPEKLLQLNQSVEHMNTKLNQLSERHKEILFRSRLLGQTYQEISDITGLSVPTISRNLNFAINSLKRSEELSASIDTNRRFA
ncbi:MAG: sigma-70 family RNA polymerase sigma factor [Pseudomonadota bacterium]